MLEEIARRASAHAVEMGAVLVDAGCVALVRFSREAIVARVRDGPVLDVSLHAGASALETSCTCALHVLGLVVCRHVWATLVAAHRADVLVALEIRAGPTLRVVRRPGPGAACP